MNRLIKCEGQIYKFLDSNSMDNILVKTAKQKDDQVPPNKPEIIFNSVYDKVFHATSMGKFLPKGTKEPHYGLSCLADQRLLHSAMQFSILCNVYIV